MDNEVTDPAISLALWEVWKDVKRGIIRLDSVQQWCLSTGIAFIQYVEDK